MLTYWYCYRNLHNIRPTKAFSIAENAANTRLRIIVLAEFLPHYNEIDFAACGEFMLINLALRKLVARELSRFPKTKVVGPR